MIDDWTVARMDFFKCSDTPCSCKAVHLIGLL
jgi:hypothetical protein